MKPKIIENFVGKEICDYINSYMQDNNLLDGKGKCVIYVNEESGSNSIHAGWSDDIYSLLRSLKKDNMQDCLIYDLFNLIGKNMCQVFDFKNSEIVYETSHYKCFGTEQVGLGFGSEKNGENGQFAHVDNWGEGGKIYTAILYMNDEYEGGDIVFYENNDLSKPQSNKLKTGSLVYFDGYTLHGVENVTSGKRACFILHIRHKGEK